MLSRSSIRATTSRLRGSLRTLPPSPSHSHSFHTTALRSTATPDWQQLIGGRATIQKKRQEFEDKYAELLRAKADKEGITVEELKARAEGKAKLAEKVKAAEALAGSKSGSGKAKGNEGEVTKAMGKKLQREKEDAEKAAAAAAAEADKPRTEGGASVKAGEAKSKPQPQGCGGKDNGVKPLNDILDLSKAATLSSTQIAQLWTTYHQKKGFLSAAIPTETYERMTNVARKYPLFVLPLARDPTPVAEGETAAETEGAVEMHLLQWAFLPPPPTVLEPIPAPTTVLFTPLAEYQSRQSYAQPYLILTHYTDLSRSHNTVLMRGEVTDSVALSETDAQILAVRMQLFYNHSTASAGVKGGEREEMRKELLRTFHEKPQEFDLELLVKTAWELD